MQQRLTKPGSKKRSNRFAVHVGRVCCCLLAVSRPECQIGPSAVTLRQRGAPVDLTSARHSPRGRHRCVAEDRWALPGWSLTKSWRTHSSGGRQTKNACRAAYPAGVFALAPTNRTRGRRIDRQSLITRTQRNRRTMARANRTRRTSRICPRQKGHRCLRGVGFNMTPERENKPFASGVLDEARQMFDFRERLLPRYDTIFSPYRA